MCSKSFYHELTLGRIHLRVRSMPHLHSTWTSSKQKWITMRHIPYTYTSHSSYLDEHSKLHQRQSNELQCYSLIIDLQHFHNLGKVKFELDAQKGFVFLNVESLKTTKTMLVFTPHKLPWCSTIYQEWVQTSNLDHPIGLKLPTWIHLRCF